MNTNSRLAAFILLVCTVFSANRSHALTLPDLQGNWRFISYSVPSKLTLLKDGQNRVTGIVEAGNFEHGTGRFAIDATGGVVGEFIDEGAAPEALSGTAAITGQGKISLELNGGDEGPIVAFINVSKDFMIHVKDTGAFHDYIFFLKEPASVSGSDLQGTWSGFTFQTPKELNLIGNPVVNVQGRDSFAAHPAGLTVAGNGSFTGFLDINFVGNFVSYSQGNLNLNIDPEDGEPESVGFFINAGKNIIMQIIPHAGENSKELIVFVKQPVAAVAGDGLGHWRIGYLGTPNVLSPVYLEGFLTELGNRSRFESAAEHLTAGTDGYMTAAFKDRSTTGRIHSITSTGGLSLTIDDEAVTIPLQLNAAADVMFKLTEESTSQDFVFAVKTPPPSGRQEESGLIALKNVSSLKFLWAPHPDRVLEESGDLLTWTAVPSTAAQREYTPVISGNKYYRVARP